MRPIEDYIKVILKHEGGYINHPNDPGGETKYGICKRQYPNLDIKNLTIEQAIDIYKKDYWEPLNIDDIKDELLKLHIFDMAVNAGKSIAIKLIQKIVLTKTDGKIGPHTLFMINNFIENLVPKYKYERMKFYTDLAENKPKLSVFLKGWINRVNNTKFE